MLVELAHFVAVKSANHRVELLLFLAEDEVELQALGIQVLECVQVVDEHCRRLLPIAIEQDEAAMRLLCKQRLDH